MQIFLLSVLGAIVLFYLLLFKFAPKKMKVFLRKKWWILPVLLFVVALPIIVIAQTSATMSEEEIVVRLEDKLTQQLQEFDNKYGYEGSTVQIISTKLKIEQPQLYLGNSDLVGGGDIEGSVGIVANIAAAYPHLEKTADSYTHDDIYKLKALEDNILDFLNLEEGLHGRSDYRTIVSDNYHTDVYLYVKAFLDSEGNEYFTETSGSYHSIFKNGEKIAEIEKRKIIINGVEIGSSSSGSSSGNSGGKCPSCNGTGSVRYNYGSSDLEAILSGHDPYTYGQCGSCGGAGIAR